MSALDDMPHAQSHMSIYANTTATAIASATATATSTATAITLSLPTHPATANGDLISPLPCSIVKRLAFFIVDEKPI
jgi:hypothetical protein